jgi:hypothetical protein
MVILLNAFFQNLFQLWYYLSYWLDDVLPKFNFCFGLQWANLIGPSLQKNETTEAPQIEGSTFKYRVPPPLV